jgi:hypothetical protein
MLLYVFGLDASTGKLNYTGSNSNTTSTNGVTVDSLGNIIIYDPEYNSAKNPVYYQSPNIIVPNPANNNNVQPSTAIYAPPPPSNSSTSPAYQS